MGYGYMPKITITKAFQRNDRGNFRYYSPLFDPAFPRRKPKAPVFDLDARPSKYIHMKVKTEKELIRFIYDKFGPGTYRIIAHIRGRKGSWTFWRGQITDEGYQFTQKKSTERRELEKLKQEMEEAESDEERQSIQDMMDSNKEILKLDKDTVKLGFVPYLKPSVRRGVFAFWDDPDMGYKDQLEEEYGYGEDEDEASIEELKKQEKEDEEYWKQYDGMA